MPEVTVSAPSDPGIEGNSITILCQWDDGFPELSDVQWLKDGTPINGNDIIELYQLLIKTFQH